jgi:hypothetical protein
MKWEKGLLVSMGFVVGGLSYGSLPEKVNLGSNSDLAQAFLPALEVLERSQGFPYKTSYHGFFSSGQDGQGLHVKCSTKEQRIYIFEGCDVSKVAAKDTAAPMLTAEDLIFAQPKLTPIELEGSAETVKWSLPPQAPLAQSFYLGLPVDFKKMLRAAIFKHGFFPIDGEKGYLVECSKLVAQEPPQGGGRGRGQGYPDYIPLLKSEGFQGCKITLTTLQEAEAPLITIEDLVKAQVPKI